MTVSQYLKVIDISSAKTFLGALSSMVWFLSVQSLVLLRPEPSQGFFTNSLRSDETILKCARAQRPREIPAAFRVINSSLLMFRFVVGNQSTSCAGRRDL